MDLFQSDDVERVAQRYRQHAARPRDGHHEMLLQVFARNQIEELGAGRKVSQRHRRHLEVLGQGQRHFGAGDHIFIDQQFLEPRARRDGIVARFLEHILLDGLTLQKDFYDPLTEC